MESDSAIENSIKAFGQIVIIASVVSECSESLVFRFGELSPSWPALRTDS